MWSCGQRNEELNFEPIISDKPAEHPSGNVAKDMMLELGGEVRMRGTFETSSPPISNREARREKLVPVLTQYELSAHSVRSPRGAEARDRAPRPPSKGSQFGWNRGKERTSHAGACDGLTEDPLKWQRAPRPGQARLSQEADVPERFRELKGVVRRNKTKHKRKTGRERGVSGGGNIASSTEACDSMTWPGNCRSAGIQV